VVRCSVPGFMVDVGGATEPAMATEPKKPLIDRDSFDEWRVGRAAKSLSPLLCERRCALRP
jgi:hypothetical protein